MSTYLPWHGLVTWLGEVCQPHWDRNPLKMETGMRNWRTLVRKRVWNMAGHERSSQKSSSERSQIWQVLSINWNVNKIQGFFPRRIRTNSKRPWNIAQFAPKRKGLSFNHGFQWHLLIVLGCGNSANHRDRFGDANQVTAKKEEWSWDPPTQGSNSYDLNHPAWVGSVFSLEDATPYEAIFVRCSDIWYPMTIWSMGGAVYLPKHLL